MAHKSQLLVDCLTNIFSKNPRGNMANVTGRLSLFSILTQSDLDTINSCQIENPLTLSPVAHGLSKATV